MRPAPCQSRTHSSEMSPGRLWPSPFLPLIIMAPIHNQQALVAYPITIGWIWMKTRNLGDTHLWLAFDFVTEIAPARHSVLDSRHPFHLPLPSHIFPSPPSNNLPSPTFCGFPAGPFTRPKAELTMLCDIIVGHVRTVRALDTAEVCQPIYS